MLNPAWQPAQEHAERLIHISHHFLSDNATPSLAKPPQASAADPMQLPVLLAIDPDLPERQDPGYLLRALTRQLNLPDSMSVRTGISRSVGHATWSAISTAIRSSTP